MYQTSHYLESLTRLLFGFWLRFSSLSIVPKMQFYKKKINFTKNQSLDISWFEVCRTVTRQHHICYGGRISSIAGMFFFIFI